MQELASKLRNNLDALMETYAQRLQAIAGYPEFTDQVKRDIARDDLELIADCLETEDETDFIDFTRERARERLEQGFTAESLMEALTAIEYTLSPLITSAEAAKFLWRMMSRARDTVSRQADRMLRQAEQRFRSLTDSLAEGIFIHQEGVLQYVGREAARILGYDDPDALVGRSILDFVHPDERQHVANMARRRIAGEDVPEQYETRLLKRDGSLVDVWLYSTLIKYKGRVATQGTFIDITRRKRAEEMLERRAAQLTALNRIGRDVASILDQEDLLQRAVDAVQEELGYTQAAVLLMGEEESELYVVAATDNFWEIIPDDYRQPVGKGLVGTAAETGETLMVNDVSSDSRAYRKGEWFSPSSLSVPIKVGEDVIGVLQVEADVTDAFDENDSIVMNTLADQIGVALENARLYEQAYQEIAERKRVEGALRKSETLFRSVVENAHSGILIANDKYEFTYVNDRLCEILGYSRDELIGMDFRQVLDEKGKQVVADRYVRRQRGEDVAPRYELSVVRKDGEKRQLEMSAVVIQDSTGKAQTIAQVLDVTERRRAMERLKEREEQYRALFESANDAIFLMDEDEFVDCNDRTLEMFDCTREQILGESPRRFSPPRQPDGSDSGKEALKRIRRALEGEPQFFEWRHVRYDGTPFDAEVSLSRVDIGGEAMVQAIVRDITERKQLGREIQRALESRERQVETTTEVSQEIAAATALDELFNRVVTLVKERFGYYHVQIFRHDPRQDAMMVVEGYGEAGEKMKAAGHSLPYGEGVVGTAAAIGEPVLASDVSQNPDWVPHPVLPDTRGELAVPIKLRDEVLGVLDVQSDQAGGLTEEDQIVLMGLAGQIAIAVDSTRLREEMEENLRELERLTRVMSREGWEAFRREAETVAYLFDRTDVVPRDDLWMPEIGQAAESEAMVAPDSDDGAAAVAPLTVRGGVIGALGVQGDSEQPLSEDELALLEAVSDQVALALESARLFERTQRALAQTDALYNATQALIGADEPEEMLQAVAAPAFQAEATAATLFYIETNAQDQPAWAEVVARVEKAGESDIPVGTRYHIPEFPLGRLFTAHPDQPQLIADVEASDRETVDERTLQVFSAIDVRAIAVIPLMLAGRWIGVVTLDWPEPHEFSRVEQRLYETAGPQLAARIENRRLFERTQEALEQVEATHRLYLREQWEKFVPARVAPFYERSRPDLSPLGEEVPPEVDQAMAQRGMVVRPGNGAEDGRAAMVAPIMLRGEVIGALGLHEMDGERDWTDEEVALIESVTEQLALALENARLLEDAQRSAQRDRLVAEITSKVRASADVESIMRTAVREIGTALDVDRARVRLGGADSPVSSETVDGKEKSQEV